MHDPQVIVNDFGEFRSAVTQGLPYKPLYVKLKLMWACNLRCFMCNHWRDPYETPMDTDRLLHLIDELADMGCVKVHITGGEPTLRDDLDQLISRITERGMRATMTTNGTRLTHALCRQLTDAGLHKVNISLDSPDPQIHDRVRGVQGAWAKTIYGIQTLRNYLYRPNSLRLNTVISEANFLSLKDLPELAHQLRVDRLNLIPVDRHTQEVQGLSQAQIQTYNREIAPHFARSALKYGLIQTKAQAYPFGQNVTAIRASEQGHHAHTYYDRHRCYAPWTHALIDHVGRVSVCCMTTNQVVMGDLRQNSFREIWTGSHYQNLRQCQNLPQLPQCRQCDMFLQTNRTIEAKLNPGWQYWS
jgi:radical SAM protein with 4Fe4S-binding SPASM domain